MTNKQATIIFERSEKEEASTKKTNSKNSKASAWYSIRSKDTYHHKVNTSNDFSKIKWILPKLSDDLTKSLGGPVISVIS